MSFFWMLLHDKHQDTGTGRCCVPVPGLFQNPHGLRFVACSRQGSIWSSPLTMIRPIALPPTFCSENPIAFLPQCPSAEPTSIISKNKIPELFIHFLTQQRPTENTHVEDVSSVSTLHITDYLLTSVCLGAFRFFV